MENRETQSLSVVKWHEINPDISEAPGLGTIKMVVMKSTGE